MVDASVEFACGFEVRHPTGSNTWQIEANLDDVRRQSGTTNFTNSQGFSGGQYSGAAYKFMTSAGRFINISIPQGSIIFSAYLRVSAEANRTENTVRTKIDGEDVDTATQITSAGNFDGRARTAAKVNWDGIGNWAAGNWYTSPDIKTVIQEIIDRGGWSSGNAINIFWGDFEDQRSDVNARRDGTSHDSNPGNAAKLEITWGVPASQDLACGFEAGPSEALPGEFIVRQAGTQELPAELAVRQPSSEDLTAGFMISQSGSEELPAAFEVRQGGRNLPGEFVVRGIVSQDLAAELVVRHSTSQDLAASFDGQAVQSLLAELIVRQPGSAEFLAGLISRHAGLQELLGEFVVRHPGSAELLAELIVRHSDSEELPGKFAVRRSALQELAAKFVVRHTATLELKAGFLIATYSVDLIANIYVRPTGSRATDFEVKDNTRGLTVRDLDRTMTVTAGRRMGVR